MEKEYIDAILGLIERTDPTTWVFENSNFPCYIYTTSEYTLILFADGEIVFRDKAKDRKFSFVEKSVYKKFAIRLAAKEDEMKNAWLKSAIEMVNATETDRT